MTNKKREEKLSGFFMVPFCAWLIPSSCTLAVVQEKILNINNYFSVYCLLSSAMTLEKFHGWNIQLLEEEMIAIERSGDVKIQKI